MAKRLKHYNGKFGPNCPDGWRRVEVGETLCVGDRVWAETDRTWKDCPLAGVEVTSGFWIRIRRIDPAPDAAPVAAAPQDAPEKADCPYCDELRRQLEATLRRVEAEQSCRQIAENACVAAEKACVYHQGEADKAREERDEARAFSAAAHKEMDELRIQLRSAHDAWAVVERERDAARREREAALIVLRVLCGRDE